MILIVQAAPNWRRGLFLRIAFGKEQEYNEEKGGIVNDNGRKNFGVDAGPGE